MNFRSKHIADSVAERISKIADSIKGNTPLPPARKASVVNLQRQDNGDLVVTKSFDNGEQELLTISNSGGGPDELPAGFVEIPPGEQEGQTLPGVDTAGIVEATAGGGNALDALLQG